MHMSAIYSDSDPRDKAKSEIEQKIPQTSSIQVYSFTRNHSLDFDCPDNLSRMAYDILIAYVPHTIDPILERLPR